MIPEEPIPLLIVGLGNVLLGDDGLGVAAVERLWAEFDLPEGVQLIDGGTLGLSLLPLLERARRVILVDAIAADAAPGSLVRLEGDDVAHAAAHRLSPHQVGVADLLDGLRLLGGLPEEIVLLGLVPERIELSLDRTERIERRIPSLVEAVAIETAKLDLPLRRRTMSQPSGIAGMSGR